MSVDSVQRLERVTRSRIVSEAAGWRMQRRRAEAACADVLDRAPAALDAAAAATPGAPERLFELVSSQIVKLRSE